MLSSKCGRRHGQFAREVKGVDLRSTAGNCAWVRTPQLAWKHVISLRVRPSPLRSTRKPRRYQAIDPDISLRVLPAKCASNVARRLWERATSLIQLSETNFPARPAILLWLVPGIATHANVRDARVFAPVFRRLRAPSPQKTPKRVRSAAPSVRR